MNLIALVKSGVNSINKMSDRDFGMTMALIYIIGSTTFTAVANHRLNIQILQLQQHVMTLENKK